MAGTTKDIPIESGSPAQYHVLVDRKDQPADTSTKRVDASIFVGPIGPTGATGATGSTGDRGAAEAMPITKTTNLASFISAGNFSVKPNDGVGSYSNAGNLSITSAELDQFEVVFNYIGGVWSKVLLPKPASRKVESLIGGAKDYAIIVRELIDVTQSVNGYVTPGGNGAPDLGYTGYKTTEFVKAFPGAKYSIGGLKSFTQYDENFQKISTYESASAYEDKQFTLSDTAYYFRISYLTAEQARVRANLGNVFFTPGNELLSLNRLGDPIKIPVDPIVSFVTDNNQVTSVVVTKELLDQTAAVNGFLDGNINNLPNAGYAGWKTSAFIAVYPNAKYTFSRIRSIIYFNEKKERISYSDLGSSQVATLTMPATCYYVRWSYLTADAATAGMNLGDSFLSGQQTVKDRLGNSVGQVDKSALNQSRALTTRMFSKIRGMVDYAKDIYLLLHGDSIMAWQSTMTKSDERVTRVPPTCDRKGLAYRIWQSFKFGVPQYRRFDDGKASLVGNWDNTITDDSTAFFTEVGTWYTRYMKATTYDAANLTAPGFTTLFQNTHPFPNNFDDADTQRNIPRRFTNSANGSTSFVIPAGYTKCDFNFHAHLLGDNATITTNKSNGVVKVARKQNDWSNVANAFEANGYVLNTALSANIVSGSAENDTQGLPCIPLHFQTDGTATTVTITKSSDTGKYFLYWGVSFWGTTEQPHALHIMNNARGGHSMQALQAKRDSDVRAYNSDAIIFELPLINQYAFSADLNTALIHMRFRFDNLKTTFDATGKPVAYIIPHTTVTNEITDAQQVNEFYTLSRNYVINKGGEVIGDAYRLLRQMYLTSGSPSAYSEWLKQFMHDVTTHPNEKGFDVFQGIIENI